MKFNEAVKKGVLVFEEVPKMVGWHANLRGDCTDVKGEIKRGEG